MKKALLAISAATAVVVIGLVALILMQPATTHVERTLVIDATPADIWPHISDVQASQAWSPWNEKDPAIVHVFSDPTSGPGAFYTWEGNDEVGKGKMAVRTETPPTEIVYDLEFIEPFAGLATITYTVTETDAGSAVAWIYDADNDFMTKAVTLVMDMDAMLGPDFDKGLAKLKPLAEGTRAERVAAEEAAAEAQRLADEAAAAAEEEVAEAQ